MLKKLPFGIIAGICAMLAFYGIVAFVGVHIVLSGVAAQTSHTSSIFENWWQVLLFIFDIIFVLGCFASLGLFIYQKKKYPKEEEEE